MEKYGEPNPEKQKKYEELKAQKIEREKTYTSEKTYMNELKKEDEMKSDEKFEKLIGRVHEKEGEYEDRPEKIDQPTNMGITQKTLDEYNKKNPELNFPSDLKQLSREQVDKIYKEEYYDAKRISEIHDTRIAFAVMDMGVMTSPKGVGTVVQQTINQTQDFSVKQDKVIGSQTIDALNRIPENRKDDFVKQLIENRLEYLQGLKEWEKYKNGWIDRTNGYMINFD